MLFAVFRNPFDSVDRIVLSASKFVAKYNPLLIVFLSSWLYLELGLLGVNVVGQDGALILMGTVVGSDDADSSGGAHQSDGARHDVLGHGPGNHGGSLLVEHAHGGCGCVDGK